MKKIAQVLLTALVLTGCYPYPDNELTQADLDIVITNFNGEIDFKAYNTYVLFDSVALIIGEDEGAGSDDPFYQNGLDQAILAEIRKQMDALDYEEVTASQFPDIGVAATAFNITNVNVVTVPGWWWGYPGYGWWGPVYTPGFSPSWYNTFYTYQQGSVIIDMEDLKMAQTDTTLIWNAVINGLVDESTNPTADRVVKGVESAFKQSRNFYPREVQ